MVLSLVEGHQTKVLLDWTTPNLRRGNGKKLLSKLGQFLDKYNEHAQVKAYDMQAPPLSGRAEEAQDSVAPPLQRMMETKIL